MIPHSRPTLGPEEREAIEEVLNSGQIAQGKKVAEFEKAICRLVGRRFGVALGSGTSALHLTLLALGIAPEDEVILPSFTCAALLHALDAVRARPIVADIDPEDFNISVTEVKKKIRKQTKAILVPHSFGQASRIKELLGLKIPVIEDGTQALGAQVGEKRVGSFGVASVFSFYATKMITTGEGGMVLTDSAELAEKLRDMRDYDKRETYRFRTNSKMTDLGAAMGVVQIKRLSSFIQRRREIASRYQNALCGSSVIPPIKRPRYDHVYYRYVVRVPEKSGAWLKRLRASGVEAKEPVFKPLHRYLNLSDAQFPHTTQAMKESCSLPIYPSLSDAECSQICQTLREELSRRYVEV